MSRVLQHKTFSTFAEAQNYQGAQGELAYISSDSHIEPSLMMYNGTRGGENCRSCFLKGYIYYLC